MIVHASSADGRLVEKRNFHNETERCARRLKQATISRWNWGEKARVPNDMRKIFIGCNGLRVNWRNVAVTPTTRARPVEPSITLSCRMAPITHRTNGTLR